MLQKFFADKIGSEYMHWKRGDKVFIAAPTGSGKTYFILNVLMPYALKFCFTILYVVNRYSLRIQIKMALAKLLSIPYETPEELDKIDTFKNITIVTYQHLEKSISNKINISLYEMGVKYDFHYVVFDEAHYFIEDSMFNPRTELIYKAQRYHFHRAVRIFISATLDEFMEYCAEDEDQDNSGLGNCLFTYPRQTWCYSIPADYSNYSISYFKDFSEVCDCINLDQSDNKWLIFVSQIEEAKKIKAFLKEEADIITAKTRNDVKSDDYQAFHKMLEDQKFYKRILIATSVIDCGINLIDDDLINIVISTLSRTQFLQMLGRKRRNNNATINLYIDAKSLNKVNGYKKMQLNEQINLIYSYRKDSDKVKKDLFESEILYNHFHLLFRYDGYKFKMNELAIHKIFKTNEFCGKIIKRFKSEGMEGFIKEQLSWLGLEDSYDEKNWLNFDKNQLAKAEIQKRMNTLVNIPLNKKQQQELREFLTQHFFNLYGTKELDRASDIIGINKINKILNLYDYGFQIVQVPKSRITHWVINKQDNLSNFQ